MDYIRDLRSHFSSPDADSHRNYIASLNNLTPVPVFLFADHWMPTDRRNREERRGRRGRPEIITSHQKDEGEPFHCIPRSWDTWSSRGVPKVGTVTTGPSQGHHLQELPDIAPLITSLHPSRRQESGNVAQQTETNTAMKRKSPSPAEIVRWILPSSMWRVRKTWRTTDPSSQATTRETEMPDARATRATLRSNGRHRSSLRTWKETVITSPEAVHRHKDFKSEIYSYCSRLQLDVCNLSLGCAIWWMLTR